jgi:hypothetical protein
LTAGDKAVDDWVGSSVSISSDGNTVILGAYGTDSEKIFNAGAVYVFVRSGTTWKQQAKFTVPDGSALGYFGNSTSLSADGNTAIVGMKYADH